MATLAVASMNETAKMAERVKIYFGKHFVSRDDKIAEVVGADGFAGSNRLKLLYPRDS